MEERKPVFDTIGTTINYCKAANIDADEQALSAGSCRNYLKRAHRHKMTMVNDSLVMVFSELEVRDCASMKDNY